MRAFNQPPWSDGWTAESARDRLARLMAPPDAYGIVAEDGAKLVGFALGLYERLASGEQFYLREMCTAPERQRSGVGGALLAALNSRLSTRDVRAVFLVTRPGSPAAAFYQKHGYAVLPYQVLARPGPCFPGPAAPPDGAGKDQPP